jgi:signal transduction histidine kinase
VVVSVDATARAAGLREGHRVAALADGDGPGVPLRPLSLVRDFDRTGSFAGLRELLAHQRVLYDVSAGATLTFVLADGRRITLERTPRPLGSLPAGFWLLAAAAVVPFLIGAGVWSYRDRQRSTRLLMISGAGFMVMGLANLVYGFRQPSVEPALLQAAVYVNQLGGLAFFYSIIALLLVYPRRLGGIAALPLLFAAAALLAGNTLGQWVEWPGNTFAFPMIAGLPLFLSLIALQWWLSRRAPLDRAALQWFILTIMTSVVLAAGLYFLPTLTGHAPLVSLELAFGFGLAGYLGLALGVVRYRLFRLGEWWLGGWLWLAGGSAVVALDFLIVYLTRLSPPYVVSLSVFLVGWVYFPLRQWLWRKFLWGGRAPMAWVPQELLAAVVAADDKAALDASWAALLRKLFQPLAIEPLRRADVTVPRIGRNGLSLLVPGLGGSGAALELHYRSGGRQLFSPADTDLLASLLSMTASAVCLREARAAAAAHERERIMRDLHDDVGARLLTLSHRLRHPRDTEMAHAAMRALRETIYSLNQPDGIQLEVALADWRYELGERLEAMDIDLNWRIREPLPTLALSAEQRVALGRVLREAVSNALRHGRPGILNVAIGGNAGGLRLVVEDDGGACEPAAWTAGAGLTGMRQRIGELGGAIHWHGTAAGCTVVIELPASSFPIPSRERGMGSPPSTGDNPDNGTEAPSGPATQQA